MSDPNPLNLPDEIQRAVDEGAREEGVTAAQFVSRAVREHLWLRRFRLLNSRLSAKAQTEGIRNDQDVFDAVS